jgi:hypothetical protein
VKLRRHRAVVYGPYPPIPGASSAATLEHVRGLLASGNDVRVISPTPSAAHEYADLRRPMDAWRLGRQAFGAKHLTLHLDSRLIASTDHRRELPARLALAVAVRSAGRSTVHVPEGQEPLPTGWARFVVDAADEVLPEVEDLPDDRVGEDATGSSSDSAATVGRLDWTLGSEPTRDEIEAEIRRRAAIRRATGASGDAGLGVGGVRGRGGAIEALRAFPRLGPAPPRSANPLAALVKKTVRRLVAWQIDPVIEQVNLLHWAVREAIDPQDETVTVISGDTPGPISGDTPGPPAAQYRPADTSS